MKCKHCSYEWTPRVENPKKCPRCGVWLNWSASKVKSSA